MGRRQPRSRGFTLLELLIALAVTSLVVALIFASFGLIGRAEERNQAGIDRAERMLLVSRWLSRKFEGLRPLSRMDANNEVTLFFNGNAAGAMWVSPLPERGEPGGLHVFRAGPLRHADGSVDLLVEALPYDRSAVALDWSQAVRAVLLSQVVSLQWSYQDGVTGQWLREWTGAMGRYPVRVRVELGDAKGDWPPLVFALPGGR